jgi:bifunctional non-homologous end joining protein LigD
VGRIFIDYLRNGFGATTICAWSARARPGLGVSVPVEWEEVPRLTGGAQWTVQNIHTRLDQGNAPWREYGAAARGIGAAMKVLGFKPS